MRKLTLTVNPHTGVPKERKAGTEQVAKLLTLWSGLGAAGLSVEALALQPLLADNARFVVSLAQQYQNQGVSQEVLVRAAHETLITLLNQYAGRPGALNKVMTLGLRNAMVAVIQEQAGSPEISQKKAGPQ
ncbi:hypothetical protein [Hymenobacter terricola]|uniref:hypothetical protein n=1 Tax=Hymenobacter terricola TaxID=2819236 RepID=UPI001B314F34|nr:hypothetical protein [Hymenobacter terricola]